MPEIFGATGAMSGRKKEDTRVQNSEKDQRTGRDGSAVPDVPKLDRFQTKKLSRKVQGDGR